MNVQHQYKSVLGTAAAIAAAVMGENGHSCDGESHMAGGGRRVDALVPPVGRHGYRFLPSSPWSRYRHPPARPTMHVTGSRSPRETVSKWGQTSVKAMISTGSPRPFPTRPLPQHMYAQYYAGRYGNLQYGNYDTKVNITRTMSVAPRNEDHSVTRGSRSPLMAQFRNSCRRLVKHERRTSIKEPAWVWRSLPASAGIRHVTRIGRETSRGCNHIRVCRLRRL